MSRALCIALFAALAFAPLSAADDCGGDKACGECPVAKNIDGLIAGWNGVVESGKSVPEADRAAFAAKVASLAKECPIGSRVGGTLTDSKAVLASLVTAAENMEKNCPCKAAMEKGGATDSCNGAIAMLSARTALIKKMHQLATVATSVCCSDKACCASKGNSAAEVVATPACDKDLAAKMSALNASWQKAGPECVALTPEKRKEIMAGFEDLSKTCKSVSLVMPTVLALADGFDALNAIQAKMDAFAAANPTLFANVSEEMKACYANQKTLVAGSAEAFKTIRATLKGGECKSCDGCAKSETKACDKGCGEGCGEAKSPKQ